MRRPGFIEGVLLSIVISIAVTAIFTVMSAFFPTRWLLNILIAAVSFSYVLYLLFRSAERTGMLTVITIWGSISVLIWIFSPSIMVTLFIHVGLIWLVRALYFYTSLMVALIDLGLILFAMASAIWTLTYTNSLFFSIWCFFLLQSLFVFLPADLHKENITGRTKRGGLFENINGANNTDRFEQAHQGAQSALRQMSAQR